MTKLAINNYESQASGSVSNEPTSTTLIAELWKVNQYIESSVYKLGVRSPLNSIIYVTYARYFKVHKHN